MELIGTIYRYRCENFIEVKEAFNDGETIYAEVNGMAKSMNYEEDSEDEMTDSPKGIDIILYDDDTNCDTESCENMGLDADDFIVDREVEF